MFCGVWRGAWCVVQSIECGDICLRIRCYSSHGFEFALTAIRSCNRIERVFSYHSNYAENERGDL